MARHPLLTWQAFGDDRAATLFFLRTWAEAIRAQAPVARSLRREHDALMAAAEYGEDWSPDDRMIGNQFRKVWAAEATVIWMAGQLDRWLERYAADTGQVFEAEVAILRTLRNALEHLDEAEFERGNARRPSVQTRPFALDSLPDRELFIGSTTTADLFGLVSLDAIETAALRVLGLR